MSVDTRRNPLGPLLRQRRLRLGLTQAVVAAQCQVSRTYISHTELGDYWPTRQFWVNADRAVRAGGELLAAYDARDPAPALGPTRLHSRVIDPHLSPNAQEADVDLSRRQAIALAALVGLPAASVVAAADQSLREQLSFALATRPDPTTIASLTQAVGDKLTEYANTGTPAIPAVRGYADLIDRLLPNTPHHYRPALWGLRANLGRALAWSAYDSGRYDEARHEYAAARQLADNAADPHLSALILCNLSLLETRDGHPGIGLDHAASARYWARAAGDRRLLAYAADMTAEACTERHDPRHARLALEESHRHLTSATAPASPIPDHVYGPALAAGFRAECLLALNDAEQAIDAANRCVAMFPTDTIAHGFATIGLANALRSNGDIEQAADLIAASARVAVQFASSRLVREILDAHHSLATAAPGATAVTTLATHLDVYGIG